VRPKASGAGLICRTENSHKSGSWYGWPGLLRLLHFLTASSEWCTVCQSRHSVQKKITTSRILSKTTTWYSNIYNEIASDVWAYQ